MDHFHNLPTPLLFKLAVKVKFFLLTLYSLLGLVEIQKFFTIPAIEMRPRGLIKMTFMT
jgi:hypothetical protein